MFSFGGLQVSDAQQRLSDGTRSPHQFLFELSQNRKTEREGYFFRMTEAICGYPRQMLP